MGIHQKGSEMVKFDDDISFPDACQACGGLCCRMVILPEMEIAVPKAFDKDKIDFEIERIYQQNRSSDPSDNIQLYRKIYVDYWRELPFDPRNCEYLAEEGCVIPYEQRPFMCRQWFCCGRTPKWLRIKELLSKEECLDYVQNRAISGPIAAAFPLDLPSEIWERTGVANTVKLF